MNIWPVIARELRGESRHPINYWLRVGGAASLTAACLLIWRQLDGASGEGSRLFAGLNAVLLLGIWLVGPLVTADCLSRERREGTLGLLFLTRLGAFEVVTAKLLVHAMRAFTVVLAVCPVLMIPVLLGGVTGRDAARALLLDFSALLLALVSGLIASACSRDRVRSMFAALALAGGSAFVFVAAHGYFRVEQMLAAARVPREDGLFLVLFWQYLWSRWDSFSFLGITSHAAAGGWWGRPAAGGTDATALWMAGGLLAFAAVAGVGAVAFAAGRVRRSWHESNDASGASGWFYRWWCTPWLWPERFDRRMRSKLGSNPILWLRDHTVSGRLTKWGWLLGVVIVNWFLIYEFNARSLWAWQAGMIDLLGIGIAFSAVHSFQRERQTGVWELLLVTPLGPGRILAGELWMLWRRFLPVTVFLVFFYFFIVEITSPYGRRSFYPGGSRAYLQWFNAIDLLSVYWTVPVLGMYLALRRRAWMSAWIAASVFGVLLPSAIGSGARAWLELEGLRFGAVGNVWSLYNVGPGSVPAVVFLPIFLEAGGRMAFGLCAWLGLHRAVKRRAVEFCES